MPGSPPYATVHDMALAVGVFLVELLARAEAVAVLRRLEITPGPDPVQQVVDLARDVAQREERRP